MTESKETFTTASILERADANEYQENRMTASMLRYAASEIEALRNALEVFIKHYEPWMDKYPDDTQSSSYSIHTFGDIRKARAAIKDGE